MLTNRIFGDRRIQENNTKWEEWVKRRDEARKNQQPFDEPSPAEQARTKS